MEQIIIKNLWKSYDSLTVLKNVDLTLDRDQTYCLMSPSGTGKTTLFRILMGLEKADAGEIVWNAGSGSGFGSAYFRCFSGRPALPHIFTFRKCDDGAKAAHLRTFKK